MTNFLNEENIICEYGKLWEEYDEHLENAHKLYRDAPRGLFTIPIEDFKKGKDLLEKLKLVEKVLGIEKETQRAALLVKYFEKKLKDAEQQFLQAEPSDRRGWRIKMEEIKTEIIYLQVVQEQPL